MTSRTYTPRQGCRVYWRGLPAQRDTSLKSLALTIVVFTFSRLVVNFTRRFPYPFIPAIAEQLGTSVGSVQTALALSWGVGLASPIFGTLSERYGRKPVMLAGLLFMAVISLLGAVVPQFWMFAAVAIGYGIGKMIFDPALQAYIGERIPYHNRAKVWGAIEFSWAGSLFIAAPLTGFLLARSGLGWVFVTLAGLMLVSAFLIWRFIPRTDPTQRTARLLGPIGLLRQVRGQPRVLAALGFTFCIAAGQEIFFINYGLWMEASFDLVLTALGIATITIGIAEAVGEVVVALGGDRLGKRNLALYGAVLAGIGFLIVPTLTQSLGVALTGMFVVFVLVEASIVASITLFTELLPEARAVVMSTNISASASGRLLGALVGSRVLALTDNFVLVGAITMIIVLVGCAFMWRVSDIS